ncbi:MAG: septum formation protein Maf [Candidatus Riflebacteria bacterium]|nr:septum formation protein Maf [Candidatus Riflebacteria bacterium]
MNSRPCRILLGSASPRRREILSRLGVRFVVVEHTAEELATGLEPELLARENARRKARTLVIETLPCSGRSGHRPSPARGRSTTNDGSVLRELVLTVDTIVVLDGAVLGKPRDVSEARRMLRTLSGRTHEVVSGLHLEERTGRARSATLSCTTRVTFRTLTRSEIRWYAATGEGLDKAGAYGIQDLGTLLVERVEGCYFNVVGFPVATFLEALRRLAIPFLALVAPGSRGWIDEDLDGRSGRSD